MSFVSATIGRLFLVQWNVPEAQDIDRVLTEAKRAHAAFGGPVIFVSIIAEKSPPPDAATRAKMSARMDEIFAFVDKSFAVVEGGSVGSLLKRTLVRTMMTLSRRRGTMRVVASVEELVSELGTDAHAARSDVLATAARLVQR